MPSQKRKDDDLVPKDKQKHPAKRVKDSQQLEPVLQLPEPNALPEWDPLVIENDLERGQPQLPHSINKTSLIALLKLFFTEQWLDVIVKCTNANAVRIQEKEAVNDFRRPRS